jgi:hypothetical protein
MEKSGRGTGEHRIFWKATCLEWAVVQSFSIVEPGVSVWWKQFEGWSMGDLKIACCDTDDVELTSRRLFDKGPMQAKMFAYVAGFTGASIALDNPRSYYPNHNPEGEYTIEEVVKEWCDGTDPMTFVILMKARNESMHHLITRLKNTNNILRADLRETNEKCAGFANRVRFLSNMNKKWKK